MRQRMSYLSRCVYVYVCACAVFPPLVLSPPAFSFPRLYPLRCACVCMLVSLLHPHPLSSPLAPPISPTVAAVIAFRCLLASVRFFYGRQRLRCCLTPFFSRVRYSFPFLHAVLLFSMCVGEEGGLVRWCARRLRVRCHEYERDENVMSIGNAF